MAFNLEQVEKLLDSIGLDLMMISDQNLVEVSELLGKIEALEPHFAPLEAKEPQIVIASLVTLLEKLIRGQIVESDKAFISVGEGLSILQDLARSLPAGVAFKSDISAWEASWQKLVTESGLVADEASVSSLVEESAASDFGSSPVELPEEQSEAELKDLPEESPEGENYASESDLSGGEAFSGETSTDGIEVESTFCTDCNPWCAPTAQIAVEPFILEFTAAVEELQVLLVAGEQKSDPVVALGELTSHYRDFLTTASLLQLEPLARLSSGAINLIEYVLADQVAYAPEVTDILLRVCDYLLCGFKGLIVVEDGQSWEIADGAYDKEDLDSFFEELWLALQGIMPTKAEEEQDSAFQGQGKPKRIGEILVAKGLITEDDLGELIVAQQKARQAPFGDLLVEQELITAQDLQDALSEQKKHPEKRLGEILITLGKLDIDQLEQAVKEQETQREVPLGEFLVKQKIGEPAKLASALREQKQAELMARPTAAAPLVGAQTVKVETMKLDGLIDLVGELVIAQSLVSSNEHIASLKEQKINKDLAQVSRITSELQRNAMSLRMVQIRQTFQKMNRLVRDLAHKFEKDVRFETVGNDTEIDRNMVESIYDPLVHLVRNALDHGMEMPSERKEAGKSLQGVVRLKAYHQGGNVVIELSDDGRGLDTEKVLNKAIEQGLVSPGEHLSDSAIHALVFQPGFSTAAQISDVSGRGVGMDVVKKSVEKMRGKVDFTSVFGQGSTMTIRLPLTLAIIDGMIVRVGENRYILPTISISESFRPQMCDYFTVKNSGEMVKVREHLLPLMRLDSLVDAHGALRNPEDALVVVLENEGESRCLLVDEVLGKQEVVIKSLGESLKHVRALAGGTILGDGRVGLILDVGGLFELSNSTSGGGGSFATSGGGGNELDDDDDWGMEEGSGSWGI